MNYLAKYNLFFSSSHWFSGISFTPREAGDHYVSIKRVGKHIPGSPFKIKVGEREVGDAKKVVVTGKALHEGKTHADNTFNIDTRKAGQYFIIANSDWSHNMTSINACVHPIGFIQVTEGYHCQLRVPAKLKLSVTIMRMERWTSHTVPLNQAITSWTWNSLITTWKDHRSPSKFLAKDRIRRQKESSENEMPCHKPK